LVVNGELQQRLPEGGVIAGAEPLGLFELATVGIPCALAGSIFLITIGPKLLPYRSGIVKQLDEHRREYLVEMQIQPDSLLSGQTVEQAGLRQLDGLFLIEIDRTNHIITPVTPNTILAADDILVFTGEVGTIVELEQFPGLLPAVESEFIHHPERHLVEVVLSRKFPLLNSTIREASFRHRYNAAVVAVHREGERLAGKVGDITLQAGDTLLLQTTSDFMGTYRNSKDFYLVSSVEGVETRHPAKASIALILLGLLLLWLVVGSLYQATDNPLGITSPAIASMGIAVLMILTRCLKPSDARNAINIQVLLTIAAALGLGKALSASGAAHSLASTMLSLAGNHPIWILLGLYFITVALTETISNNAVAAMLIPLAIEIAQAGDINARPLIIAITIAASLSFITPIGYQTNLMVMGPGGYRSRDYLQCGLPLALLMAVFALTIIPQVWPF
ncbi:MAG: SLC13 family permease, partial [Planctomycetota bacterium]|nr:SLC13 family permease [Planctomycetota bacterium]